MWGVRPLFDTKKNQNLGVRKEFGLDRNCQSNGEHRNTKRAG